jgi:hypothetical protein
MAAKWFNSLDTNSNARPKNFLFTLIGKN